MTENRVPRVVFQPATYQGMQRGINQLVSAVRPTLGPRPRVVAIEGSIRDRTPELLDDGGTIARRIIALSERNADMGAMFIRQVLWRVHERVGDGTTTTAVLFQSIFDQGVCYVVAGGGPMQLRRYLEEGAAIILDELSGIAKPLQGEQHLAQIAESICHDAPLAKMLGEVFNIIGDYGQVDVRSGRGRQLERQYVEGMYWDGGIFSRAMITDRTELKTELQNASILLSDLELEDPRAVIPVLEMAKRAGISRLLILARKVSDSVSGLLVSASREPERFQVIAAKTPGTAVADLVAAMEDLAVLVGARPLVKGAGHTISGVNLPTASCGASKRKVFLGAAAPKPPLAIPPSSKLGGILAIAVKLEDLGGARRAWADRYHFGIVGGRGDPRALRTHIGHLRTAFERATETDGRRKLQERIGKLMGGSATLWVGGATELEIESRKDLAKQTADALRGAVRGAWFQAVGFRLWLAARPCSSSSTGATIPMNALPIAF